MATTALPFGHRVDIALLGAGAWGSALAILLASHGHRVALWGRDEAAMAALATERENHRYLPGVTLPPGVIPGSDLSAAIAAADRLLIAVPSSAFIPLLEQLREQTTPEQPIAWATKGLEPGSGRLLHQVVADRLGDRPIGVVSGPSFAKEVALGLPTALTIAADPLDFADDLATLFNGQGVRIYTTTDLVGVQLGGAVKNVLAIAAGIADGLGFGANARAAVITRGLAELKRLGGKLGARPETLMGLSGMGDLILTCTDDQSRNRRFGLAIGQGKAPAIARQAIGTVEGEQAALEVAQLAQRWEIAMPITACVAAVLRGELTPRQAVELLLAPPPKAEFPETS